MRSWATGTAALALITLVGCSSTQKRVNTLPPPSEEVVLDPILIRANVKDGEVLGSKVIDSSEVFKAAQKAFKSHKWEDAATQYQIIIDNFSDSNYYLPSLYNRALCLGNLDRWEDALKDYNKVVEIFPGKAAATDALYRIALCQARLKRHEDVVVTTNRILDRTGLESYDRVEALVRRGDALLALKRPTKAETSYREAMKTYKNAPEQDAVPQDSYFVVAARYGQSKVYHHLFHDVKFKLPVETMEESLATKVKLFQLAQSSYIRTMKMGNPHWATAAGNGIGRMYEEFYADLLNSEIPELKDEEARIYFDELRSKLRPLMQRALQIYEKNITLSERYGVDNDYTRETEASLARLKRYITDSTLQTTDEDSIRKGVFINKIGDSVPEPPAAKPVGASPEPKEGEEGQADDKAVFSSSQG